MQVGTDIAPHLQLQTDLCLPEETAILKHETGDSSTGLIDKIIQTVKPMKNKTVYSLIICGLLLALSAACSNLPIPGLTSPSEGQPAPGDQSVIQEMPTSASDGLILPTSTPKPLVLETPTAPPSEAPQPDLELWAYNRLDQKLIGLDPRTFSLQNELILDGVPGGLAVTEQGAWVLDIAADRILRIDPATNSVAATLLVPGFKLRSIAAGEGSVWVGVEEVPLEGAANTTPLGGVLRLDPNNDEISQYIETSAPVTDFAFRPGEVWIVATSEGFNTLSQIDPLTNAVSTRGDSSIWYETSHISANKFGLWLLNTTAPNTVQQIDLTSGNLLSATKLDRVPGTARDIVASADAIWILMDTGTVARFDPQRLEVYSIIPVSSYVDEIFSQSGAIYVSSQFEGKVFRVDIAQNRVTASYVTGTALPTPTPTAAPTKPAYGACDAAYLSRLHVGDRAKVSETPPQANRVRSEPNIDAETLGYIQPGAGMKILEGPQCSNNWVWWKVQADTGLVGWTSEGDEKGYWLVVIP